ncbi:MAG: hypothetical protein KC587_14720 [Nitrospira sp.]|nr:hypothetical protein [Nitrospira sp.]
MNITDKDLQNYIEIFTETLEETARQYLAPNLHKDLLHLSLLPSKIIGYVSTQLGVAIEYVPGEGKEIEIRRGSARVEDLFVQGPRWLSQVSPMLSIEAVGLGIYGLTVSGRFPFRLSRKDSSIFFEKVTFEAGSWQRFVHYAEVFEDRSLKNWTTEKAVARAKDEVLVAVVEAGRAKEKQLEISDYIDKFKKKTVLVLGDYDAAGEIRLQAISRCLESLGYEPLLIKDVPDHPYHDLSQKVVAVGAIARFVVVDDSSRSGHLLEVQLCKTNSWVTVLLRAKGHGGSWMTAGAASLSNVILEADYDPDTPDQVLTEVSAWAEGKLEELQRAMDSTYPWRNMSNL